MSNLVFTIVYPATYQMSSVKAYTPRIYRTPFTTSWSLAFLVVFPEIIHGRAISYFGGIFMFPAMLLGPSIIGIILTAILDGRAGLNDLVARMRRWRVGSRWYAALLIPPTLILVTLTALSSFVSPVFTPNVFVYGVAFGILAGYLEEIGWTGYAFPKMSLRNSPLTSAMFLGAIWGLWHAPVVDFLGAAYPHGAYWLPFYLSFIALVMAMRVLIVWIYSNTKSTFLAQGMHASSTGFLAVLAPALVSPAQEASWYALYALALWVLVALIVSRCGRRLVR